MRVKINNWQHGKSGGWYKDRIGETFEVINIFPSTYMTNEGDIIKEDCCVVDEYKDIQQIHAGMALNDSEISRIPKEKLDKIIKSQLAHELSNFIIQHIDEIPTNYKKEVEPNQHFYSERHTVRLNIISDEELSRLRRIEREYEIMRMSPQKR